MIGYVDSLLGAGYIAKDAASFAEETVPGARENVLTWLGELADAKDWRRFERLAGVAVHLRPEGVAGVIVPVLESGETGMNVEDLVDMLGEVQAADAVPAIARLIDARQGSDGPYFALTTKCVLALGEIGTEEAREVLRAVATGDRPKPLKWHAAVELEIEDELGFDEDEMLAFP